MIARRCALLKSRYLVKTAIRSPRCFSSYDVQIETLETPKSFGAYPELQNLKFTLEFLGSLPEDFLLETFQSSSLSHGSLTLKHNECKSTFLEEPFQFHRRKMVHKMCSSKRFLSPLAVVGDHCGLHNVEAPEKLWRCLTIVRFLMRSLYGDSPYFQWRTLGKMRMVAF